MCEKTVSYLTENEGRGVPSWGGGGLGLYKQTKHTNFNFIIYFVHYMPKLNNHSNTYIPHSVFRSVLIATEHYVKTTYFLTIVASSVIQEDLQFWTISYYIYKE